MPSCCNRASVLLILALLVADGQLARGLEYAGLNDRLRIKALTPSALPSTVTVTTCEELREALRQEAVAKVVVDGNIVCSKEAWRDPVKVRRNLEMTGEGPATADGGVRVVGSIDWTNASASIVMERAAVAYFHDLVVHQESMGIGGLDLGFIRTRQYAVAVFAGLVVGTASCALTAPNYADLLGSLPRPWFLAGQQTAAAMGASVLHVGDLAILWPVDDSLWQVCDTVFECGVAEASAVGQLRDVHGAGTCLGFEHGNV